MVIGVNIGKMNAFWKPMSMGYFFKFLNATKEKDN